MISISNPQYLWISLLWIFIAVTIRWISHHRKGYRMPTQRIIKRKQWIRKWIQIILVISLLLLPLKLQYRKQTEKDFIIIWDSSLSMHSEDTNPSRYNIMNEIIRKLEKSYSIKQCYSQSKLDLCTDTIIIPNSGSSVSDLLAVALYSSSDSKILEQHNFLVMSDWGINNGIDFDSLFISWKNYESIYRVDLMPNEEIIISWNAIAHQQLLQELPPIGDHYIRSSKKDSVNDIWNTIETIVIKNEWTYSINPYLILIILLSLSFLFSGHVFSIIKNQPPSRRSE